MIVFDEERVWSSASWLFKWVVEAVLPHVQNDELAQRLRMMQASGVYYVELAQLSEDAAHELCQILTTDLIPAFRQSLPDWSPTLDKQGVSAKMLRLFALAQAFG